MSLKLLTIGTQINRVKIDMENNIELLKTDDIRDKILYKFLRIAIRKERFRKLLVKVRDKYGFKAIKLKADEFYSDYAIKFAESINEHKFVVNVVWIILLESLFYFTKIFKADPGGKNIDLGEEMIKVTSKLMKIVDKTEFFYHQYFNKMFDGKMENHEFDNWLYKESSIGNPDFDYLFAMTLRQMPIRWIPDFFEFQIKNFESRNKFIRFVKNVLIEHSEFIPAKNIEATNDWIDEEKQNGKQFGQTIKTDKILIQSPKTNIVEPATVNLLDYEIKFKNTEEEFDNSPFKRPKFEFDEIQLKLQPKHIREFLSFLWKEKNGSSTTFIGQKFNVQRLIDYGIFVPEKPLRDRIHLNIDSKKRTSQIFWDTFYHFYDRNKLNQNQKQFFVSFIYNTFDNFDGYLNSKDPNNYLRDYKLTWQRKFDLDKYTVFNLHN